MTFFQDGVYLGVTSGAVLYSFSYDDNASLLSLTDANNHTLSFSYDTNNHLNLIESDTSQYTAVTIDANATLKEVRYEDNTAYSFTYDENDLLLVKQEPKGNRFTHLFDSNGRVSEVHDDEGGVYGYESGANSSYRYSVIHYPEGEDVTYRNYNESNGDLRSTISYPSGDVTTIVQSADGTAKTTTQCGMNTYEAYAATHPRSGEKLLTLQRTTTPSGLSFESTYDYNFTDTTQTQSTTHNQATSTTQIDYANHTLTSTSATGMTTQLHLDANMRNLLEYTTPLGIHTAYNYDSHNRLLHVSAGNRNTSYSYNERGKLQSMSENNATETTTYGYDTLDRLNTITKTDGTTLRFSYDANGNMQTLTTPSNATNSWEHNAINKPTLWQSPLAKETRYGYDKKRRLTTIERPSGKTLTHTYTNGQKVETNTTERTYSYTYACGNKPLHVNTSDNEAISYGYDGDLLTNITQSGTLNQSIAISYNTSFLPSSITYADVNESISYDSENRITTRGSASMEYNLTSMTLNDTNFSKALHVNPYGELQNTQNAINHKTLYSQSITSRDLNGRILTMNEKVGNRITRYTYAYDTMGRLVTADTTSGIPFMIFLDDLPIAGLKDKETRSQSYMYDANGNRVSTTQNGITTTLSHSIGDQLETIGNDLYAYDEDGALSTKITDEGTTDYNYGTLGELRSVVKPDGTIIEYVHNANNQRVAKKVNGEITHFTPL